MPERRPLARFLRTRRLKIALSLAIGYLLVEIIALPVLAAHAPLRVRLKLPGPLYVLSQSSKAGLVPEDWTLVLGDSYAHGYGDWLAAAQHEPGNPPFHSTHVLNELTGDDVISFGQGGAGSMKGAVYLVQKRMTAIRRAGVGAPSRVIVFVYEGNDFVNNIAETERYGGLHPGDGDGALAALCDRRAAAGLRAGVVGTLFFPALVINTFTGRKGVRPDAMGTSLLPLESAPAAHLDSRPANVVRTGGELFRFMGPAQGPPLGLDGECLDWSVATLEVSLRWLKQRFEGTPVCVVLVPSPLSCYELVSPQVELDSSGSDVTLFDASLVDARHGEVVARVAAAADRLALEFQDATAALRAVTATRPIHGMHDGSHFNRAGYEALGQFLALEQAQ